MAYRERDWVRWLQERAGSVPGLITGIGDDAAVLDPGGRGALVFASDQTLEGVHFQAGVDPWPLVGRKALARVLSDMAAMAARPWAALVSIAVPPGVDDPVVQALLSGLMDFAQQEGAAVVGGDMARSVSGFFVDVSVIGALEGRAAWTRSGARAGDRLYVSGELGGSRAGHHLRFQPRWREAIALGELGVVTAAMDLSDGLGQDLPRLCEASGVGARVNAGDLPRRCVASAEPAGVDAALHDGEDFELLLAVDPAGTERVEARAARLGLPLRSIGEILPFGLELWRDGAAHPFPQGGYEHF